MYKKKLIFVCFLYFPGSQTQKRTFFSISPIPLRLSYIYSAPRLPRLRVWRVHKIVRNSRESSQARPVAAQVIVSSKQNNAVAATTSTTVAAKTEEII
jgi:hypothetical protein